MIAKLKCLFWPLDWAPCSLPLSSANSWNSYAGNDYSSTNFNVAYFKIFKVSALFPLGSISIIVTIAPTVTRVAYNSFRSLSSHWNDFKNCTLIQYWIYRFWNCQLISIVTFCILVSPTLFFNLSHDSSSLSCEVVLHQGAGILLEYLFSLNCSATDHTYLHVVVSYKNDKRVTALQLSCRCSFRGIPVDLLTFAFFTSCL